MRLRDKVAIVTGSASGLGKAMIERFAAEGAAVVVADVRQEAIDAVVTELKQSGHKALGLKVDVTSRSELRDFMATVAREFGRIDILVNNAGVNRVKPFETI